MINFVRSAFADEYSSDFTEQLKELNKLNIGYIELRNVDGKNVSELTLGDVKTVKSKLNDYGVKASSIGSPIGKIKLNGDLAAHLCVSERVFETAAETGAKYVRIFSFYMPDGVTPQDAKSEVYDNLDKLVELAKPYGVTLCHENEAAIYGESVQNCLEIMETFKGKIKCVFDMGNFVLDGFNAFDAYKKLFPHIEYFHVKDSLSAGAVVPPGKGEAEIEKILGDYKQNGKKDAFITLEPHLQTFGGLNALVGKSFDNPYKYDTQEAAFEDANDKLLKILGKI